MSAHQAGIQTQLTLRKLRQSNISRMRAPPGTATPSGMTPAVCERVTYDRLTAGSALFSAAVAQS